MIMVRIKGHPDDPSVTPAQGCAEQSWRARGDTSYRVSEINALEVRARVHRYETREFVRIIHRDSQSNRTPIEWPHIIGRSNAASQMNRRTASAYSSMLLHGISPDG